MNWITILDFISDAALIAIAAYATRQIFINQKQLHVATINNCIKNFEYFGHTAPPIPDQCDPLISEQSEPLFVLCFIFYSGAK